MMLLMFVVFTRYFCRAHPVVPHIPTTAVHARIPHAKPCAPLVGTQERALGVKADHTALIQGAALRLGVKYLFQFRHQIDRLTSYILLLTSYL